MLLYVSCVPEKEHDLYFHIGTVCQTVRYKKKLDFAKTLMYCVFSYKKIYSYKDMRSPVLSVQPECVSVQQTEVLHTAQLSMLDTCYTTNPTQCCYITEITGWRPETNGIDFLTGLYQCKARRLAS